MRIPSLALALTAATSLAHPAAALLGTDTLVDLALWGAGALSTPPRTGRLPGGPPEGGWSWTNCGRSPPPFWLSLLARCWRCYQPESLSRQPSDLR